MILKCTFYISAISVLSLSISGCGTIGGFFNDMLRPERIVPVFDPNATITPQTGTVIYRKNGIVAMAVPIHDVKNLDAFAVLIYNDNAQWISFEQENCQMLDQSGNIIKTD